MIYIKEERDKSKNHRSRRNFLSIVGMASFILATSTFFVPRSNKTKDEDEYIFVNGWLLKREDLNDI